MELVTYIWPVFPPVAILAAVAWDRFFGGVLHSQSRRLLVATLWISCLGGPAILPTAMVVAQHEFSVDFSWGVWVLGIAAATAALAPLAFWLAGRHRAALITAMCLAAVQFAVVMAVVMPPIGANTSARGLAQHFNQAGELPRRLLMAEERIGSLIFYLDPGLRAGLRAGQFHRVRLDQVRELPQPLAGAVFVVAQRQMGRVGRYVNLDGVKYQMISRYRVYDAADLEGRLRR